MTPAQVTEAQRLPPDAVAIISNFRPESDEQS
jgi:hypothetical protein